MTKTIFRVFIPINPQEMIELGEAIDAKHTADALNSPLIFMDMDGFKDQVIAAKAQDVIASEKSNLKDIAFENRDVALGINANVSGTVDYYVKAARDILVGFYKNHEDALTTWGFDVTKSKGIFKINIPTSPDKVIKLAVAILAKDTLLGVNSPIKGLNIVDFTAKTNTASSENILANEYKGAKEIATTERDTILGILPTQSLSTPNTVRFYIVAIRDVLLGLYKNTEQNLEAWGYSVSLGPKPQPIKKSVQGLVSNSQGVVLENVQVKVIELNISVLTDSLGKYSVPKQPNGIYTIEISKPNYVTQTFNNIVFDSNQVYELNAQLVSLTSILIATVFTEGMPLVNATVNITELSLLHTTDDQGMATFPIVPPGSYNVAASFPGKQTQTIPVILTPNSSVSISFDLANE